MICGGLIPIKENPCNPLHWKKTKLPIRIDEQVLVSDTFGFRLTGFSFRFTCFSLRFSFGSRFRVFGFRFKGFSFRFTGFSFRLF